MMLNQLIPHFVHTGLRFFSLILFVSLMACSQLSTGADDTPAEMATDAGKTTIDSQKTTSSDSPTIETAAIPTKPKIKHKIKPALPTLHDMIGLDRDQVSALLGKPKFRRQDAPADLWQYGNGKCILDLFLYKIRDGNIYKVTHTEIRPLNGAKITNDICFEELIRAHNKLETG